MKPGELYKTNSGDYLMMVFKSEEDAEIYLAEYFLNPYTYVLKYQRFTSDDCIMFLGTERYPAGKLGRQVGKFLINGQIAYHSLGTLEVELIQ